MNYSKIFLLSCAFVLPSSLFGTHARKRALIFTATLCGGPLATASAASLLEDLKKSRNRYDKSLAVECIGFGLTGTALIWQAARAMGLGRVRSPEHKLWQLASLHNIVSQGFKYYPHSHKRLVTHASLPIPLDRYNSYNTFSCTFSDKNSLQSALAQVQQARPLLRQIRREFGYRYDDPNEIECETLEKQMENLESLLCKRLENETPEDN